MNEVSGSTCKRASMQQTLLALQLERIQQKKNLDNKSAQT